MAYPNLKAEMARRDIKQFELAEKVGVSEPTFSCWMNGKTEPLTSQSLKIAKILNCSVEYLFSS